MGACQGVAQARGVQAELGWSLRPEETGQGYATEAVEAVLDLLRRPGSAAGDRELLRRQHRFVPADGTGGHAPEAHTVKDALHPSGEWMDGYTYALLADEWRQRTQD